MISEIYKYIFLFKANKDATALNNPQYFANPWFAKYEVAQLITATNVTTTQMMTMFIT